MPKKIYPNEMREWLEQYDSGQSEAEIAKSAHRDVRTVKKRIGQARREREAFGARVELLKTALKNHQDRLLNSVKEVEPALVLPSRDLWSSYAQISPSSPRGFIDCTATYTAGKGWTVALSVESKTEWGLVQEHLKGDPIWASLAAWRRALGAHIEAMINIEAKCADLLMEKTGYKLVPQSMGRSVEPPFLYSWGTVYLIYHSILDRAPGIEQAIKLEDALVADTENGVVWYARNKIADVPGEEERCKANILAAVKELLQTTEATKVGQTHKELEEAITKAKRAVEEILLLELVTGECRVCRRLGV